MRHEISKRLKQTRENLGLSQSAFGKKIGLSFQHVSRYERGVISPTSDILTRLHERLNVSIDWLLTGRGSMFANIRRLAEEDETQMKESIKTWIDEFWKLASAEEKIWFMIEFGRQFCGKKHAGNPDSTP